MIARLVQISFAAERFPRRRGARAVALLALLAVTCGARLPASDYSHAPTHAVEAADTPLGQVLEPMAAAHPGLSGFFLLTNGTDAFRARLALVEASAKTLDIQYYSVGTDLTGRLLLEAVLRAADRGVRVRFLVDDVRLRQASKELSLLDGHPHIEIRVFNPLATRKEPIWTRMANYLTQLGHYSKRMHNKALIVDNQLAIIGGRNLGDEYFDASANLDFKDLDTLSAGAIVADISKSFDSYWNSREAYAITALYPRLPQAKIDASRAELDQYWQRIARSTPWEALQKVSLARKLREGDIPLVWTKAELAVDNPLKVDAPNGAAVSTPGHWLTRLADAAHHEFLIISPYFVPLDGGVAWLRSLAARGVKVKVLTNSLASTDVVAVHAGYSRYRRQTVAGGVDLYEFKPLPGEKPHKTLFGSSSRASLHAKTYIIDRRDVIIGSFNLDPRSVQLNTEIALVIHSPVLAEQVAVLFEKAIQPASSFHVQLESASPGAGLIWKTTEDHKEVIYHNDPQAGLWRNVEVWALSVLRLDKQL